MKYRVHRAVVTFELQPEQQLRWHRIYPTFLRQAENYALKSQELFHTDYLKLLLMNRH
jgi:hypothetical protein